MSSTTNPRRRAMASPAEAAAPGKGLKLKTLGFHKGATFHSPTSPKEFAPPALRRADTSHDEVVDAHCRRMAMTLDGLDKLLNLDTKSESSKPAARRPFHDNSLPVPAGFLKAPVVNPLKMKKGTTETSERRILRPRNRRSSNHASDSGIGSSLSSGTVKQTSDNKQTKKEQKATAITRSAVTAENLPGLSKKAVGRIEEHILRPLSDKSSLKDFQPIVTDVPRRIRAKEIVSLRDLEKTLIFMAPVSQLLNDSSVWANTYKTLTIQEKSKTSGLYLDFCMTSIRCIQATVEYLPDHEQTQVTDRPYTSGYFVDLVDQIRQYAGELAAVKDSEAEGDNMDLDQYATPQTCRIALEGLLTNTVCSTDEVRLFGGITKNGRPAELVRIRKDGKAVSLATGLPVDMDEEDSKGPISMKRSMSEQLKDEEEIQRSMARRKKNASPEELAPKKCREPGCNKEFKRPCDLTKHEKTHSRPWKCPVKTCKYHEYGWPTEKEMDRHHNDKHSSAPPMHECHFQPCPYKSKRESNLKQHMEKAHNWTYVRTKTNGKKPSSKAGSSAHQTPQLGNMPTPSSNHSIATPPEDHSAHFVDYAANDPILLPRYPTSAQFDNDILASMQNQPMMADDINLDLMHVNHHTSPGSTSSYDHYSGYEDGTAFAVNDDIYSATAQLPAHNWQVSEKIMAGMQHYPLASNYQQQPYPVQMPLQSQQPVSYHPQQQQLPQQHQQPRQQVPHFSPTGEGNTMLYTPTSLAEVDEGFDEDLAAQGGSGDDFQLFPANNMGKGAQLNSLFTEEVPSSGLGFSQPTSQDFMATAAMDWNSIGLNMGSQPNMDYAAYQQ